MALALRNDCSPGPRLLEMRRVMVCIQTTAIAAMHGPHSVFDIGKCMVIHCDAGGVSLVDQ